ncbi:hypothetical protein BGZ73_002414 [Actinomortierella ambigua]|nr:hypothetical protein BGZ73_002414 [Actinomortierella ambigua]
MSSNPWSPPPLIPPFRFGTVEHEVYRGAYPKQRNLRFLKRLKLRTVLSLIPDAVDDDFLQFCEEQGIRWVHLPVGKVKDNVPLTYSRTVEAIQVIIDPDNMPIYIHCLDGACVTGLVIACIRKLQTWNISSALGEFLRYLRGGVISSEESVFVEKFSSEIEISRPIPPWLWEGQITFKRHPTLKITFKRPPEQLAATNHPRYSAGGGAVGIRGATYAGSQISNPPYQQEQQQPHHQQQHVAFAAAGPHPGHGRASRHHHSSSSVSSVLGFQSLSDGGGGATGSGGALPSFLSLSPTPEMNISPTSTSLSPTPPPIAATTTGTVGDDKDATSLERDASAFAVASGASSGSSSSQPPSSASSTTTGKDQQYPRLSRTKSSIRAELATQRPITVSTPTLASMKEARARRPSLLNTLPLPPAAVTPTAATATIAAATTSSPYIPSDATSATFSPASSVSSVSAATASSTGTGATGAVPQVAAMRGASLTSKETLGVVSSPTPGEGTGASGAPGSDASPARASPLPTHSNESSSTSHTTAHRAAGSGSGGAGESDQRGSSNIEADEYYYDVSLTLKALSLEGADW